MIQECKNVYEIKALPDGCAFEYGKYFDYCQQCVVELPILWWKISKDRAVTSSAIEMTVSLPASGMLLPIALCSGISARLLGLPTREDIKALYELSGYDKRYARNNWTIRRGFSGVEWIAGDVEGEADAVFYDSGNKIFIRKDSDFAAFRLSLELNNCYDDCNDYGDYGDKHTNN